MCVIRGNVFLLTKDAGTGAVLAALAAPQTEVLSVAGLAVVDQLTAQTQTAIGGVRRVLVKTPLAFSLVVVTRYNNRHAQSR